LNQQPCTKKVTAFSSQSALTCTKNSGFKN
jgi:hypothetical protein